MITCCNIEPAPEFNAVKSIISFQACSLLVEGAAGLVGFQCFPSVFMNQKLACDGAEVVRYLRDAWMMGHYPWEGVVRSHRSRLIPNRGAYSKKASLTLVSCFLHDQKNSSIQTAHLSHKWSSISHVIMLYSRCPQMQLPDLGLSASGVS